MWLFVLKSTVSFQTGALSRWEKIKKFFEDIHKSVKRRFQGPKNAYEEIMQMAFGKKSRWVDKYNIEHFFEYKNKFGFCKNPLDCSPAEKAKNARYQEWYGRNSGSDGSIPISKMTDEHWKDFGGYNNWPKSPKEVIT